MFMFIRQSRQHYMPDIHTIKYAWGLIPDGVHGNPCQLPDYGKSTAGIR